MGNSVRYVLFYDSGDLSLAAEHFPAHRARYTEFMDRGVLLALGPFTDRAGSMAVFTTHEAARTSPQATPSSSTAWSAAGRSANGAWHPRLSAAA